MVKRKQDESRGSSGTKRRRTSLKKPTHPPRLMNSMPTELLVEILLQCLFSVPSPDYYKTLRRLQFVCRHWYQIIKGTPSFWSFIDPLLGPSHMISVLASRSGAFPLTICDTSTRGCLQWDIYNRELCFHLPRWSSVRLRVCCHFWKRFRDALSEPLEALHYLDLVQMEASRRVLRQAHPMDSLEMPCFPRLTVLRLNSHIPSAAWLLQFLKHCPSLIRLFVLQPWYRIHNDEEADPLPPPPHPINLPNLETMDIEHGEPSICCGVLRGLQAPNCSSKVIRFQPPPFLLQAFTRELLTSFEDIIEAASTLETKFNEDDTVEVKVLSDDGTTLVMQVEEPNDSLPSLINWVAALAKRMLKLRSTKINYLLDGESREGAFKGDVLWQLPHVTELRIRVGYFWRIYPDPPSKTTTLSRLGNPCTFPNLARLSVESEAPGRFRIIDIRDMLKARYAEGCEEDRLPRRLEELRISVSGRRSSVFGQIEALVGKERFVKLLLDC